MMIEALVRISVAIVSFLVLGTIAVTISTLLVIL